MGKRSKMTKEAARRIQSAADKSGKHQDFKARAMRAAAKNKYDSPCVKVPTNIICSCTNL